MNRLFCIVQSCGASSALEFAVMAQAVVTKALQDNLVMVFSKSYCPHCVRAKRVLDVELGKSKYVVMELENRSDCADIQDYLRQVTGARTVPRVFLQGEQADTLAVHYMHTTICFMTPYNAFFR